MRSSLASIAKFYKDKIRAVVGQLDSLPGLSPSLPLAKFSGRDDLNRWEVVTDKQWGGQSLAHLTMNEEGNAAVFSGTYSRRVDGGPLKRAGFCCVTSKVLTDAGALDLSGYPYVAYTLKGDGKTYLTTLRVDTMLPGGDVWQAPLHTKDGQWMTVSIPLRLFTLTRRSYVVGTDVQMMTNQVVGMTFAFSATEDMPEEGEFRLELQEVRAEKGPAA